MAQVISLRLNSAAAQRTIARLRDVAPQRIARSLNRAGVSARTLLVREVARDLALKQSDVKPHIVTRDARPDTLTFSMEVSGARLSLKVFGARQTRKGVTANTGRGRQVYPGAFIMARNGHVFKRQGRARLPIDKLHGASLPHVFDKHAPAALARGEEQLVKNVIHELKFATSQVA